VIIVFVIDTYGILTNGTTMTALRFAEALRERGHEVRTVGVGVEGPGMYSVRERRIPIATAVARKQSNFFAEPDRRVLRQAFAGADVVHCFLPWALSRAAVAVAREMGIACTAAFHVQPENITYGVGLGKLSLLGRPAAFLLYRYFRHRFYDRVDHIHCPSAFLAERLRSHSYQAQLHVISNGIGPDFHPRSVVKGETVFDILMIGRYAPEKRQDVLIQAVALSKHERQIRLTLAGAGPEERRLRVKARALTRGVVFGFFPPDELLGLIARADLYVHAADVEIEAIACLEAIACGKVPVISDSGNSATGQFALDERSLFPAGNSRVLAERIDYWVEHDKERRVMGERYRQRAEVFSLDHSIRKTEHMFSSAIADERTRTIEAAEGRPYLNLVRKGILMSLFSVFLYFGVAVPLLSFYLVVVLGVRFRHNIGLRKVRRLGGAVTISNHVHILDCVMVGLATLPKKIIFTALPENFRLFPAGFFVNSLGSVPTPTGPRESRIFFYELSRHLRRGRFVHFYPEGELIRGDPALRPFQRGAFRLAVDAQVPVVPIDVSVRPQPNPLLRFFRPHRILLTVGEPLRPDPDLEPSEAARVLQEESYRRLRDLAGE
jgi:glycosyltransferase involved in cell wall biosynthesis/1-acyl-sn-glycerol-3-phosphate acyltransferase